MTRIIAGLARGRRLAVPSGRSTRPTSDRVRESLFAAVGSSLGDLAGTAVLDLYAGSGAIGLEALSRGAADVILVEADPKAAKIISGNIASVGLPGARLVTDRVERFLRRGPAGGPPRQLVFADPPYAVEQDEVGQMLTLLAGPGWLAPDAIVVVERDARSGAPPWPAGYIPDRSRQYGESALWYGHAAGSLPAASPSSTGA